MKKTLLLTTCALAAFPTTAYAQSTGTIATEEESTIVVTGTRAQGVEGVVVPDTTKAKAQIGQELIAKQAPGQSILNTLNLVPSVNFTNSDPYGSSGGNIRIRGFDGNRISLTWDGLPLNDTGNYAIYSNQQLDPEIIEQVNVGLGVTDVDSPTASAAGGTINYRTIIPPRTLGGRVALSIGDFGYTRAFGELDLGTFGPFDTRAFIAASTAINDKFKGPGQINKRQFNARIYQSLGSNGDFISLAGHYNRNRNAFYRNPSLSDLRGIFGVTEIPATITPASPLEINGFSDAQQDQLFSFDNLASCARTTPLRGVVQNDNSGTGANGTGTSAPAVLGSTANNPLNTASCSNFYGVRINPSNTGNVRAQSRFTLRDGLLLTIDPSFQYTLANGGGSTAFSETARQLRGGSTAAGLDLNGDGDFLDTIRLYTPNNTNTRRWGVTSSLVWEAAPGQRIRVAYTYDRGHHRQTGEWGFLDAIGNPESPFGGRNATAVLDPTGYQLQQRNRLSYALLNQISGQYIGQFFDRRLRVEVGVRRPFFKRELSQYCYTQASGSGFGYCSSEVLGTTPIAAAAGNFVVPADYAPAAGATVPSNAYYAPFEATYKFGKLLPNVGFTYRVAGPVSVFGSFAKGFSAPRTDNLYRRPIVTIDPEETKAFDLGARYTSRRVQAQATAWKINYSNRIVSSFNQDLGISLDRNVGKVDSKGVDASVAVQPIRWLSLIGLLSYIDTELKQNVEVGSVAFNTALPAGLIYCNGTAPTATSGPVTTCAPTAGKFVPETPKWQVGGRANVDLGSVEFGIQGKRVSSRFLTDVNDVRVKGYTLVDADARFGLDFLGKGGEKMYLQLNVQNLFNKFYLGNFSTQIRAADNPNVSLGGPRTFLATLNFGI